MILRGRVFVLRIKSKVQRGFMSCFDFSSRAISVMTQRLKCSYVTSLKPICDVVTMRSSPSKLDNAFAPSTTKT